MRTSILGVIAAIGSFAFFGVASPAEAQTVEISGSVFWGPGTPVTLLSVPGATSSFSFDLPNPISSNPTTQVTHFTYSTSGKALTEPRISETVEFFTADEAGMFDLTVKIGGIIPEDDVVSLYGADIGSSLTIIPGRYTGVFAGMQMLPETSEGGTVTVSEIGPGARGFGADPIGFGVVPEPSTWVMMILGFAGLAFAGYRTRRRIAPSRSTIASSAVDCPHPRSVGRGRLSPHPAADLLGERQLGDLREGLFRGLNGPPLLELGERIEAGIDEGAQFSRFARATLRTAAAVPRPISRTRPLNV
jgi:hypothetical protein